jgi:hypothetical protein
MSYENGTLYLRQFQTDIRTNAVEQLISTVTPEPENRFMIYDYGNNRINTMYYIAGDVVNYVVLYDCVSCNDYGDQGSE